MGSCILGFEWLLPIIFGKLKFSRVSILGSIIIRFPGLPSGIGLGSNRRVIVCRLDDSLGELWRSHRNYDDKSSSQCQIALDPAYWSELDLWPMYLACTPFRLFLLAPVRQHAVVLRPFTFLKPSNPVHISCNAWMTGQEICFSDVPHFPRIYLHGPFSSCLNIQGMHIRVRFRTGISELSPN